MKSVSLLILLSLVLFSAKTNAQTLGFIEPECGIIQNPSYHYSNYQMTSHGYACSLYHNGVEIFFAWQDFEGYSGQELKFVNDTTGFFLLHHTYADLIVYKIIGDDVIWLGNGYGYGGSLYIVNPFTVYLASDLSPFVSGHFWINKFSDLKPEMELIADTSINMDISVWDTITGKPLCDCLTEINYRYKYGIDTINYKIQLYVVDSAYIVSESQLVECIIYPNPTEDFLRLSVNPSRCCYRLNIYNSVGTLIKSLAIKPLEEKIYVGDLTKGIYLIEIIGEKTKYFSKMVKM